MLGLRSRRERKDFHPGLGRKPQERMIVNSMEPAERARFGVRWQSRFIGSDTALDSIDDPKRRRRPTSRNYAGHPKTLLLASRSRSLLLNSCSLRREYLPASVPLDEHVSKARPSVHRLSLVVAPLHMVDARHDCSVPLNSHVQVREFERIEHGLV